VQEEGIATSNEERSTSEQSSWFIEIKPAGAFVRPNLRELWEHRELLYFLTWREIKVRYKQTAIGAAWALLQPLFTMLIFTLFFGRLAKMPSDGIPYSVFALTALTPWTFFASGITTSSNSLVTNSNLITKVYFPRLAVPVSAVFSGIVDFLLTMVLLMSYVMYRGFWPTWRLLWLPAFFLLAVVTSLGVGLWLSALNVQYRDVRYTVPFLTQVWLFSTPIAYPSSIMHDPWRTLYGLNPMVGVVEGFRWAIVGSGHPPGAMFYVSCAAALTMLISGALYFRSMEKGFADLV
jgi:lipopolysaccharide transport system permease protein